MVTYLGRLDIATPTYGGRGKARRFTFGDIVFLRALSGLLASGIEVKRLKRALVKLRAHSELWEDIRTAPARYLVTDGTELMVQREGELESKTMNGQLVFAFVLDLKHLHRAVAASWPDSTRSRSGGRRRQA